MVMSVAPWRQVPSRCVRVGWDWGAVQKPAMLTLPFTSDFVRRAFDQVLRAAPLGDPPLESPTLQEPLKFFTHGLGRVVAYGYL